jgi:GGDEF domain-containing protein
MVGGAPEQKAIVRLTTPEELGATALVKRADDALYQAKRAGGRVLKKRLPATKRLREEAVAGGMSLGIARERRHENHVDTRRDLPRFDRQVVPAQAGLKSCARRKCKTL